MKEYLLLSLFLFAVIIYAPSFAAVPTAAPTMFLNPQGVFVTPRISELNIDFPIAQHQLVVVQPGGNSLIQLTFYAAKTSQYKYIVLSPPLSGSLYQLSQVFSQYGYQPVNGAQIMRNSTTVTGSNNRVYYSRPNPDAATNNKWGTFDFIIINSGLNEKSYPGTITLVPPSGALVGSNFLLSHEGWTITGNKARVMHPSYETFSRGPLLNYYISSTDDVINVPASGMPDQSLWYFEAPPKFHGNHGIAYGGSLSFSIGSFSGDFSRLNGDNVNVVILECETCIGPVGLGITLGYTIGTLAKSPNGMFRGSPMTITIPLHETAGWVKDSQNVLMPWTTPSKCDIIQVLSRLSKIRILGDWTSWYETVAIDNVQFSNTKGQLPLCSQLRPDASICEC